MKSAEAHLSQALLVDRYYYSNPIVPLFLLPESNLFNQFQGVKHTPVQRGGALRQLYNPHLALAQSVAFLIDEKHAFT